MQSSHVLLHFPHFDVCFFFVMLVVAGFCMEGLSEWQNRNRFVQLAPQPIHPHFWKHNTGLVMNEENVLFMLFSCNSSPSFFVCFPVGCIFVFYCLPKKCVALLWLSIFFSLRVLSIDYMHYLFFFAHLFLGWCFKSKSAVEPYPGCNPDGPPRDILSQWQHLCWRCPERSPEPSLVVFSQADKSRKFSAWRNL